MNVHGCAQQFEIMDPWFCVRVATSSRLIPQGIDFQHRDRFGWAPDPLRSATFGQVGIFGGYRTSRIQRKLQILSVRDLNTKPATTFNPYLDPRVEAYGRWKATSRLRALG